MKIFVWEYKVGGEVHQDVVVTRGEADSFGHFYCIGETFALPIYPEHLKEPTNDGQRQQGQRLLERMDL